MTDQATANRRQLPENFTVGDKTYLQPIVEGTVVALEKNPSSDWLLTLEITAIRNERIESTTVNGKSQTRKRISSVLWSATQTGNVELVIEVGARQRLPALGLSSRRKQSLRDDLASLTREETEQLLREISQSASPTVAPQEDTIRDSNEDSTKSANQ